MRMKFLLTAMLLAVLLTTTGVVQASPEVIYNKRSLYRNITVTDDGEKICMQFASRGYYTSQQSCQYKDDADELVFDYTRMSFVGLLVEPKPERILVVGLGGGSIPRTFDRLFPEAQIDVVEIDPAVVDVAERFFGFKEGGNVDVTVKDARVFVKQAGIFGQEYDYIVLDAFNGDYIPAHLMTREWLEECRKILSDDGVLVANTFSVSQLYHNESVTYEAAFGWMLNVRQNSGNRIILTGNIEPVDRDALLAAAETMNASRFEAFGFTPEWLAESSRDEVDWNRSATVLTDQYAPVNILQGRE
ncbi:MAG TPA: fused MFS/spermidine synthase [Gammaproteobacteria bacterium]